MHSRTQQSDSKSNVENIIVQYASTIIELETEEAVLWNLVKNCVAKLDFEDCVIYKADYESKQLIQIAAHGPKNPDGFNILSALKIPFGKGITGSVFESRVSEIVNDTSKDERYIVDDSFRNSELAVPIIIKDKVWGVIDCENYQLSFFTNRHVEIIEAFASICAVKLARIEAEKALASKQNSIREMQNSLLEMRVESFKSQINPHFTFNALNAIQYFITNDDKEKALRYQGLFSKLLRKYLLHISDEMNPLEEEVRMLQWYLKLQQLRYDDKFEYELEIDEKHFDKNVPTFLLQLIVEEKVELMMMSNTHKGKLSINAECEDQVLKIEIKKLMNKQSFYLRNDDNYRTGHFSWVNYLELLNKIKKPKIEFSLKNNNLMNANMIEKITVLRIPLN